MFDSASLLNYLTKYESVIEVLKHFERILSYPIFLSEVCDLIGLFSGFTWFDKFTHEVILYRQRQHWFEIYFIPLRALVSFLCVSLAASSVHEAVRKCKDVQEKILKLVLDSKTMLNSKDIFHLLVAYQSPPFVLSAWGFFYFTKSLILVAFGSIMTYSLLIQQLVSKEN
ncbi:uncharacterized protein NPIL_82161 [Nephila pilipes]|uniref:Uncharacterized protein n=1 Tax=Nephila pilipes TaxID=299642 RepID=A0A8X6UVB5_NEPPI|nr:uncharacterized protein NPIL_82161 [Nephila pilipes]